MFTVRFYCFCSLLLISPLGLADIYKWVDAEGKVHFSETAPEKNTSENMDAKLQETGNFLKYPDSKEPTDNIPDGEQGEAAISPAEPLQINIDLIDYTLSEETLETVHDTINAMYNAYQLWFGWTAQAQYPINIKLFGTVETFEQYQREKNYPMKNNSFYSRSPDREIILKGGMESKVLNSLYHEVSHAILHMQQAQSSKWLNEGLAEVFSNTDGIEDNLPLLPTDKKWVAILQHMLTTNSLQPVSEYLSIPDQQWKEASKYEKNNHYMIAWSIMYFMTTHQEGIDTMKALFAINAKQPLYGEELIHQLDVLYPGGINALDADWRTALSELQ